MIYVCLNLGYFCPKKPPKFHEIYGDIMLFGLRQVRIGLIVFYISTYTQIYTIV